MIKVCHMTSAHSATDVRIFRKECCSLAAAGYDVYLVAHGESKELDSVHIVGVGAAPTTRLKRMLFGACNIYRAAVKLDAQVYHFHDPELLPYGLKLKKKGKTVIFDSHENTADQILEKQWIPVWLRKMVYLMFDWYQKKVVKNIDAVIAVTPHCVHYFKEQNARVEMVTNYPIVEASYVEPNFESQTLVFAGGINKQWNHDKILDALTEIPQARYVLCGYAGFTYLKQLQQNNGWQQVDYRGALPHVEIPGIMSCCSIGLAVLSYSFNTAWKTGTIGNTKIFECMMAGLPVICTDFVLWKEIVTAYNCGICVAPDDVEAISNAILYLLEHPDEARQMGGNGRRAVLERYNWGSEEKKLLALYESLVGATNSLRCCSKS